MEEEDTGIGFPTIVISMIIITYSFRKIHCRDISLEELYRADEVFITSTSKRVMPIVTIEERKIGSGNIGRLTNEIIHLFSKNYTGHILAAK